MLLSSGSSSVVSPLKQAPGGTLPERALHLWSLATTTGKHCLIKGALILLCLACAFPVCLWAQSSDPADQICPRLAPGSIAASPADLSSKNGVLEVTFKVLTAIDMQG